MAAAETYNGWANYPTWCVNLWLSNDESLYEGATEIVRGTLAEEVQYETWQNQAPRLTVADAFKAWVTDELVPLGGTLGSDLLGYALGLVDWYEIADAWIESASEVEA